MNQLQTAIICLLLLSFTGYSQDVDFSTESFKTDFGLEMAADIYSSDSSNAPVILLFHQNQSSRGEYRDIAPVLVDMGFNAIAFDTRSGNIDKWNNVENLTTSAAAEHPIKTYEDVYPDLLAAAKFAKEKGFDGKIIIWGSSFSSTLVFKIASENPDLAAALLSFSPGEYINGKKGVVEKWASETNIPAYVTCGSGEGSRMRPIYKAIPGDTKFFDIPQNGAHGSSILLDDARNWKPVKEFLKNYCR